MPIELMQVEIQFFCSVMDLSHDAVGGLTKNRHAVHQRHHSPDINLTKDPVLSLVAGLPVQGFSGAGNL